MPRRYVFYLKNLNRSIVLTDTTGNEPIDEIKNKISNLLSGNQIAVFQTTNDLLIIRPKELAGVQVTSEGNIEERNNDFSNIDPEIEINDSYIKEMQGKNIEEISNLDVIDKIIEDTSNNHQESSKNIEDDIIEYSLDPNEEELLQQQIRKMQMEEANGLDVDN